MYLITKEEFLAGWISGMVGLVIGHPVETVKVHQQVRTITFGKSVSDIMRRDGPSGFFKGITLPLLSAGVLNAIFFGVYGNVLRVLQGGRRDIHYVDDPHWIRNVFHAGCWGGLATVFASNPIEVIKIRFQTNTEVKSGSRFARAKEAKDCSTCSKYVRLIKDIYMTEGIGGFYRGAVPTLIRDVPGFGVYIWGFVALDKWLEAHGVSEAVKYTAAGGLAGVLSWIFVVPFDVVKSRLQTDDPSRPKFNGMLDCFAKTYREGGLHLLMKGTVLICVRTFPLNAALFFSYQKLMEYMLM